jgi:hypothetical protein
MAGRQRTSISPVQKRLFDYVKTELERGNTPRLIDMGRALGISGPGACDIFMRLQRDGYLRRRHGIEIMRIPDEISTS